MNLNPFTVTGAPTWPLQPLQPLQRSSKDGAGSTEQLQEQEVQQLARLLSRLLEVAEYDPNLYEVLPWLGDVSLWELLLKRSAEARFPYVPRFSHLSSPLHSSVLPEMPKLPEMPEMPEMPDIEMPKTAAILLAFFARVTQPVAEMIEALYVSPLLRDTHTVWEILRRMARVAGVKPLPKDEVVAVCATLTRKCLVALSGWQSQLHRSTWKIIWHRVPTQLQWSQLVQPTRKQLANLSYELSEQSQVNTRATTSAGNSLLVLVREETTCKAGTGYQQTGKVLAFCCVHGPPDHSVYSGLAETTASIENIESIDSAMSLALFDALVFSQSRDGQLTGRICPPTLLRVQLPVPGASVPRAIKEAARVWGIKVEEIEEVEEVERALEGKPGPDSEWELEKWEKELSGRVLDPVHYMRILDRGFERMYGYAPFLTKQRVVRHQGWLWSMLPDHDPLLNYAGLRELLPSFPAVVGDDGTIEWPDGQGGGQGWHYRDYEEDVLSYFPHAQVTVRRSPLTEAVILVYWRGSPLCYAVAEELRHQDGSCRSYSFPYPRLGE